MEAQRIAEEEAALAEQLRLEEEAAIARIKA